MYFNMLSGFNWFVMTDVISLRLSLWIVSDIASYDPPKICASLALVSSTFSPSSLSSYNSTRLVRSTFVLLSLSPLLVRMPISLQSSWTRSNHSFTESKL